VLVFLDEDRQVAAIAMETTQLVLGQFKKLFNLVNLELDKVSLRQK